MSINLDSKDRAGDKLDEAQLRYLRAAEMAQDGDYEEAEAEFASALSLNPALHTARFQLGLLQLTSGRPAQAVASWSLLHAEGAPPELRLFVLGLEALMRDEFAEAIQLLESGISRNQNNAPLNKDMLMVIGRVQSLLNPANASNQVMPEDSEPAKEVRTDFSLYVSKN